uniref:Zinc finger BED domain-containing protein DAYSLEEPER n=1 Tax=Rhizophora mucronata TaxID=61149 RepID=A0A2P2JIV9_RHIMU
MGWWQMQGFRLHHREVSSMCIRFQPAASHPWIEPACNPDQKCLGKRTLLSILKQRPASHMLCSTEYGRQ